MKINIFWFRNDLRIEDNTALHHALSEGIPVLPVYIFDTNTIEDLPENDPGISFIYDTLNQINKDLHKSGSSVIVRKGDPVHILKQLTESFDINAVYVNKDYDPYTLSVDLKTGKFLKEKGIQFFRFKDRVIFEEKEIVKSDNLPYTIFTPYKNKWLREFSPSKSDSETPPCNYFLNQIHPFPSLDELGFIRSKISVRPYDLLVIKDYDKYRNIPSLDRTTHLGPHLRFGTVSIRKVAWIASAENAVFLSELIWREFFIQILFNFPHVVTDNFRPKFNFIPWRNNEEEFQKWCAGETGYPIVDAGMRQLNESGYMHNRVRMITAGFLTRHLLTDWRFGEAYFASRLLDYELASNNGNWQWAAGTGCDAAQYFRVFNPSAQLERFDPNHEYVRRWVKNIDQPDYPEPMIDHEFARKRVISVYKSGLSL